MKRAVPPAPDSSPGARDAFVRGWTSFARWVIPALAACLLFGIGDAAPAGSEPLGEGDVLGDPDPCDPVRPRSAKGPSNVGPGGHAIALAGPIAADPAGNFPTERESGMSRGPRAPESLIANLWGRRRPGGGPKNEAIPYSSSAPSVQGMARAIEIPVDAVVIPDHPNFTQLTTGPPLTGALRFLPAAAANRAGRPCSVAESVSSAASSEPAHLHTLAAVVPAAPLGGFENPTVRPPGTITGFLSAWGKPANSHRRLTPARVVRAGASIFTVAIEVPAPMAKAVRTP